MSAFHVVKKGLNRIGIDSGKIRNGPLSWGVKWAMSQQRMLDTFAKLKEIEPDLSCQLRHIGLYDNYIELKMRAVQTFQMTMLLDAIEITGKEKLTVCDIGDSAGTHMHYLQELTKGKLDLKTVSVNLDPVEVEHIRKKGMEAINCRAENLAEHGINADLFVSFEMVEHLHNPALFFRRLVKQTDCDWMLITVPYRRQSRVALQHTRLGEREHIPAEIEHIFEFSPDDWETLILHSGWRLVKSKIYYQYPRHWPILSQLLSRFWRRSDFEGFWGAILTRDTSVSDRYADWEE